MTHDPSAADLVDRKADERLLAGDAAALPADVGRPEPVPPSRTRARLVGAGATLTGVTLIVGGALIVLGVVEAVTGGGAALAIAALAAGVVLAATHWGWVHVAEATADAIEERRNAEAHAARRRWLDAIEPYTRYEVGTEVADDGSIAIVRTRHRPILVGERRFTFEREVESRELHSAEESSATVAERAELLRRQAAADTRRERERYEVAADAYRTALLGREDEEQRRAARHAASKALSERINSNLRDPPLVE
jgi:hypothetical protein